MKTCFVTCALKNHFPGLNKLASSLSQTLEETDSDFCVISPDDIALQDVKYFSSIPKDSTYQNIKPLPHRHYNTERWYPATWYKFEAFGMKEYDRVVYLDADMLVLETISELTDCCYLNDRPIWFTLNSEEEDQTNNRIYYKPELRKAIRSYRRTVSTGIMVINMDQISKFTRQNLIYLAEVGRTYDGTDQGAVNQWLEEKGIHFGVLDDKYNHLATNPLNEDTKIIHYFGRKPWEDKEKESGTIISDINSYRLENDELWRNFSVKSNSLGEVV
tara:strand:- start:2773 stop:3594 length:822 start_codon:yes stop_codon:yes gene_type:complete